MTEAKDKTAAERQRRYRQNRLSGGFTRLQLYVPDSAVDQITAMVETLTKNPSARFTEVLEAANTKTKPLPLTKNKTPDEKHWSLMTEEELRARLEANRAKIKQDRYVHPKHPNLMWSGRGRQPPWVALWIEQGGKLEELENKGG